ncbi:sugar ABC transporter ATP-binding protein, partial [Pirellulales bacterium]|nr:sugar ABC transporter ATP-binding protein [Pirellulales bacterium]
MFMVSEAPRLLEIRKVSKRFPGVRALHEVSFHLDRGETLAIIGENGAGKSTLMKILAGVQPPTSGELSIDGNCHKAISIKQAMQLGIALIHQELNLAENLDVCANIFLGREPRRFGVIDRASIANRSRTFLDTVGFSRTPQTLVGDLPIGEQQLVEIAKSLSTQARILIMDEPTSSLTAGETRTLLNLVSKLRNSGVGVIYISHRLGEVEQLADRVVVLRDGAKVGELSGKEITRDAMVSMMVGREIVAKKGREPTECGEELISASQLRTPAHPHHEVNVSLRAGEIVGVAGLVGAGRSELLTTLFGITPAISGNLVMGRLNRPPRSPREAIQAGIMLAPEDRRLAGLV